ncbi:ParB N-terminal domain-containing protein [Methanobacterium sp.]|uniref:ParB N-terminal domain-containing protein n=1 Tax=Methanobacterium sp. TaxID=2164 RepID=UPI003C757772
MIRKMNPNDLKPNPLNKQIYGVEPVDLDLVESIKKHGLLENLVIKQDGTIISGHRRWLAVLELHPKHIKNVACEIIGFPGGEEGQLLEEERLLESNRQRKKTDVQLANEGRLLEKIYAKQAEMRKLANLKQNNLSENESTERVNLPSRNEDPRVNLPQGTNGKTTEKVAKDLDMSERSYRMLKKLREASESDDQVIAQIADRLLKDPMTKNRKYNLFLNFMKIYHDCKNKNPKISDYATNMVSDIYGKFTKIENAHLELTNYIKAIENKENALRDEYPSDDYESESKEYIEDEADLHEEKQKNINSILGAKPAEKSDKPKVSPKYQFILDAAKHENPEVAELATSLRLQVDHNEMDSDEAKSIIKEKIREVKRVEQARREMMNVPEEPGEILEKESERPTSNSSKMERPKDQNNVDTPGENIPSTLEEKPGEDSEYPIPTYEGISEDEAVRRHNGRCDFNCKSCNLQPQFCFKKSDIYKLQYKGTKICSSCIEDAVNMYSTVDIKELIKASFESAKNKREWTMEDHMRLNKVLLILQSS